MQYSYQLRGTNGSGKTTVARFLLAASGAKPDLIRDGKIKAYRGMLPFSTPLIILGSYEKVCGGCDTISSVQEVADLLGQYMTNLENGIVFFEGLMISHMLGTVGKAQMELPGKHYLAFLDTPLDVCIDRVIKRRTARGDVREFNSRNVTVDHPRVISSKNRAVRLGYNVLDVAYRLAEGHVSQDLLELCNDKSGNPSVLDRRTIQNLPKEGSAGDAKAVE